MSLEEKTAPDSLSVRLEDLATRLSRQFVAELGAGESPRIEDFLVGLGDVARPVVLRALLVVERDRGGAPDWAGLRGKFPNDLALIEEVFGSNEPTVTSPVQVASLEDSPRAPGFGESTGQARRYAILRHHAKGGLGVVSLAMDRELHREVALKEIRPDSADDQEYRARFLREAEVTARLEHPGIVPVHGIGTHADGRPYYIMRFIRGETLKDAIIRLHKQPTDLEATDHDPKGEPSKPRPTLHRLVGRLVDVCQALAYAHHRKILHRDIKPGNIMLGPYGETLLVDWGLAKTIDDPEGNERSDEGTLRPESDSQVSPTRIGSRIGTDGYMSPEQAAGRLAELRPQSDLYSMGATLYYLLTCQSPIERFGRDESPGRSRPGEFRLPSEIAADVPPALEAICLKAMAFRPVDRYPTAEALADDLERWRAGEPVDAYPEPRIDRLARWSKAHRTGLVASSVLLVTATIGLAVLAVQEARKNQRIGEEVKITRTAEAAAQDARRVAEDAGAAAIEDRAAALEDLRLTRRSLRRVIEELSGPQLGYLPNSGGPRLNLTRNVVQLYEDLILKHPAEPEVKYELALACKASANIGRSIGEFEIARTLYDRGVALLDQLLVESPGLDDYRVELALILVERGENTRVRGRIRGADPDHLRALEILARRPGSDPSANERYRRAEALALIDLAGARLERNLPGEAHPIAARGSGLLRPLASKPDADSLDRLYHVYSVLLSADIALELGQLEEARVLFDEAARLNGELRRGAAHDSPDLRFADAMILEHQAPWYAARGDHNETLRVYDTAFTLLFEIYRNNFRPQFIEREMATTRIGRAEARLELLGTAHDPDRWKPILDDLTKAQGYLEQLAANAPDHYVYHAQLARGHHAQARLARVGNQTEEVRRCLDRAIVAWRRAVEFNPDDTASRKLEARAVEELGKLQADRPSGTTGF